MTNAIYSNQDALALLESSIVNPFMVSEEESHPWCAHQSPNWTQPLMRTWDSQSGSQPDPVTGIMQARDIVMKLDTYEVRKRTLTDHLDHQVWTPSSYISFTNDWAALRNLANFRATRRSRGSQTLTVINPNVRLQYGRPILDLEKESSHYGLRDRHGGLYILHHYLCLWQVAQEEIVGHYDWVNFVEGRSTYADVLERYRSHEAARRHSRSPRHNSFDSQAADSLTLALQNLALHGSIGSPHRNQSIGSPHRNQSISYDAEAPAHAHASSDTEREVDVADDATSLIENIQRQRDVGVAS